MEVRKNCWEFQQCGREPGGPKAGELGECPAALGEANGVNHGTADGRFCWTVEGTLCAGTVREKFLRCLGCPFFEEVERQEGRFFVLGMGQR